METIEETRKNVLEKLRNFEYGSAENKLRLVLAAPSYEDKNKIRVYMNGGLIGNIGFGKAETSGIASEEYKNKYKGDIPSIVHTFDKNSGYDE